MISRSTISYGLLLIAIVVLGLLYLYATLSEQTIEARKSAELKPFFPEITESNLGFVRFEKNGKKIELKKEGDKWLVKLSENRWFPVNPMDARDLVDYFVGLEPAELISEGKEKLEKFELTEEKALKVSLGKSPEDKNLSRIYLGKAGPDFSSTYAVKPGEAKIYLISENKNSFWQREPKAWRDNYPFREQKELVSKITFTRGKETFILEKDKDGFWQFTYPAGLKVDSSKVTELLSRLVNLVAMDLLDEERPEYGLDKPDFSIAFKFPDKEVSLIVSSEKDAKRYVKNTYYNQIYALSASTWTGIPLKMEDFILKEKEEKKGKEEVAKSVEKKDKEEKDASSKGSEKPKEEEAGAQRDSKNASAKPRSFTNLGKNAEGY